MSRHILAVGLVSTLFAADGCNAPEPLGPSTAAPEFARTPADGNGNEQVVIPPSAAVSELAGLPADGNGNKQVFVIDINDHVSCGTQTLARNIGGWVQVRLFGGAGNRGVELDVFHSLFTFTNSAGATFVWRDVGPDRYWIEDGNLMIESSGRAAGHLGTFIVNLATGEVVFSAGKDLGLPRQQACEALT